jgi:hypothetical protein
VADQDDEIEPDSLRVDPQVGAELFGALHDHEATYRVTPHPDSQYSGNTSHGSGVYGDNNTVNNSFTPSGPKMAFHQLTHLTDLMDRYVASDADRHLDRILSENAAVCLTGPRNSGRSSTARAALVRRYSLDRVYDVSVPAGATPYGLLEQATEIREGCGYVLRLSRGDHIHVMRTLAGLFRRRSACLLLIHDEGPREREPHRAEMRHWSPDPIKVFQRYVEWMLRTEHRLPDDICQRVVDGYLARTDLREDLAHTYGPHEAVAIARDFGQRCPVDASTIEAILSASQPRLRRRASRILLPAPKNEPVRRHRAAQHERAFRIAYAVFHGQPLHYVFESANWLLAEIDGAALRPEWGSMALEHAVEDLLGDELKHDWQEGSDAGRSSYGSSRSAWIRDPGLRGAILDVAWHDFDSTRSSLLKWLDRLVVEGDDVMARAAAETASLLVHHDFERVHATLVDPWASSALRRVRQAAAWTEAYADMARHAAPLVRGKLREWCYGGNNYQRDTAARVYASGLRQQVLEWSVRDLRRIATDRMQRQKYAVAEALSQLYEPGTAGWLVAELASWTSPPTLRVHAARGLLAIADRPAADPSDGRPDLLVRLAKGEVEGVSLAKLWRLALVEPSMSESAWRVLAEWLRCAEEDALFRPTAIDLLERLGSGRMARRMSFHLNRMWKSPGLPRWVTQVLEDLT